MFNFKKIYGSEASGAGRDFHQIVFPKINSNFENIQISRTYGEWATTKVNESRLNEAFNSVPHVYLIFTVSKIQEFKGFA